MMSFVIKSFILFLILLTSNKINNIQLKFIFCLLRRKCGLEDHCHFTVNTGMLREWYTTLFVRRTDLKHDLTKQNVLKTQPASW